MQKKEMAWLVQSLRKFVQTLVTKNRGLFSCLEKVEQELAGTIAHRGEAGDAYTQTQVEDVERRRHLVEKKESEVNDRLQKVFQLESQLDQVKQNVESERAQIRDEERQHVEESLRSRVRSFPVGCAFLLC